MLSTGKKFLSHVIPGIMRPLRILWNEMIGFVFLCLAVIAAPKAFQAYRSFDGGPEQLFRLLLTGLFLITMLSFGIASFWRARRISRSS
jgi:type VI protein secretion system component VasK